MIIQTQLRPATTHDLLYCAGLLKFGTVYYLKHPKKCTISGPYTLDKYHNSKVIESYYNSGCIYVPVIDFDFEIQNVLQQQDFKQMREIAEFKQNQKP